MARWSAPLVFASGQVLAGGVVVLPRRTAVVRLRFDLPRADGDAASRPVDTDLLQQRRQPVQELRLGRGVPHRRKEQVRTDPRQVVLGVVRRVEMVSLTIVQLALHLRFGEEHTAAHKRDLDRTLLRRSSPEQRLQLLRLLVRERERVVERAGLVVDQRPGRAIVRQSTTEVLDLYQEKAGRGSDQEIHLADVALVGDEGEVGPGLEGGAVRQQVADVAESGLLMGERGRGDLVPAARVRVQPGLPVGVDDVREPR